MLGGRRHASRFFWRISTPLTVRFWKLFKSWYFVQAPVAFFAIVLWYIALLTGLISRMLLLSIYIHSHISYVIPSLTVLFRGIHLGASSVVPKQTLVLKPNKPANHWQLNVGAQTGYFTGFGTNVCLGARTLEFENPCMHIYFKTLLQTWCIHCHLQLIRGKLNFANFAIWTIITKISSGWKSWGNLTYTKLRSHANCIWDSIVRGCTDFEVSHMSKLLNGCHIIAGDAALAFNTSTDKKCFAIYYILVLVTKDTTLFVKFGRKNDSANLHPWQFVSLQLYLNGLLTSQCVMG